MNLSSSSIPENLMIIAQKFELNIRWFNVDNKGLSHLWEYPLIVPLHMRRVSLSEMGQQYKNAINTFDSLYSTQWYDSLVSIFNFTIQLNVCECQVFFFFYYFLGFLVDEDGNTNKHRSVHDTWANLQLIDFIVNYIGVYVPLN